MTSEVRRILSRGDSLAGRLLVCASGEKKQLKLSFDIELENQQIALERGACFFLLLLLGVLISPRALLAWGPVSMSLPAFGVHPHRSFCS